MAIAGVKLDISGKDTQRKEKKQRIDEEKSATQRGTPTLMYACTRILTSPLVQLDMQLHSCSSWKQYLSSASAGSTAHEEVKCCLKNANDATVKCGMRIPFPPIATMPNAIPTAAMSASTFLHLYLTRFFTSQYHYLIVVVARRSIDIYCAGGQLRLEEDRHFPTHRGGEARDSLLGRRAPQGERSHMRGR